MMYLILTLTLCLRACCDQGVIGPIANLPSSEWAVPHKYIVSFKPGTSSDRINRVKTYNGVTVVRDFRIDDWYGLAIMALSDQTITQLLGLASSGISSITQDIKVYADAALPQGSNGNSNPSPSSSCSPLPSPTIQSKAPHGLYQISHRTLPPNGAVDDSEYIFDASAGKGTCAHLIDTGVRPDHTQFTGRIQILYNCIGAGSTDSNSATSGCSQVTPSDSNYIPFDDNGHGTHTAGTMAGSTYGIARQAKLFVFKVLAADGSGASSDIIATLSLASDIATAASTDGTCPLGSMCNLSLGSNVIGTILTTITNSPSIRDAVNAAAKKGLPCAVAAGNSDLPSQTSDPANAVDACTVGAVDTKNVKACFSNFGSGVDVWAPGVNVLSAYNRGPDDTEVLSGTSMASPHVGGTKLYLDSLCGSTTGRKKNATESCAYMKSTGTDFSYLTTLTGGLFPSVGIVDCPASLISTLALARGLSTTTLGGKILYNGGKCACDGWTK